MSGQTLELHMAFSGYWSHGHQHRSWHSVCLTCVNLRTQFLTLETSVSHKIELHGTEFIHSDNVSLPRVEQRKTLSLLLCTLGCRTEKPDAIHKDVKTDTWRETHGKGHEVSQQLAPAYQRSMPHLQVTAIMNCFDYTSGETLTLARPLPHN